MRDDRRHAEAWARPVLLLNPRSGPRTDLDAALTEGAHERGITLSVLAPGQSLSALVTEAVAAGADALGVAGGDGSMAVVAAAAHRHGLPFVCIPAGTRNHFARDLGLDPDDPVGALDAFRGGVERVIDVGSVNGRLFLNNVSVGIYGEALRHPSYRHAKARTLLETTREMLGSSSPAPDLSLVDDVGREHRHPAVLLVSNNPYELDRPPGHAGRPTLAGGRLGVIVLDEPRKGEPPGRAWTATSIQVDATAPVHAGVDGEAVELTAPVHFEIVSAALRVLIPAQRPAAART